MTNFDERAADWDTPERQQRAAAVAAAIRAHVELRPTMRAIEVGAGTGLLGLAIAGDVGEMVLADPSEGMLGVARSKLDQPGLERVAAVRFDLLADPPPGDPFDLAISLLVLHHLADTDAAFAALLRLLGPRGHVCLADLDAEDGSFHADQQGVHHRGFDRGQLAALARTAGFAEVAVHDASEIERDGRRYTLFLLVGRRP
jgi:ubiquinone/menaquinone biosynthesis C-methylase UbiE